MKNKHLVEIEVDGEVEKALAALAEKGISPKQALCEALKKAAKKGRSTAS